MLREIFKWRPHENVSINAQCSGGVMYSSDENAVMALEQRHGLIQWMEGDNCYAG